MEKETVLILLDYYFGPIQRNWTDEEGRSPEYPSSIQTRRPNA